MTCQFSLILSYTVLFQSHSTKCSVNIPLQNWFGILKRSFGIKICEKKERLKISNVRIRISKDIRCNISTSNLIIRPSNMVTKNASFMNIFAKVKRNIKPNFFHEVCPPRACICLPFCETGYMCDLRNPSFANFGALFRPNCSLPCRADMTL